MRQILIGDVGSTSADWALIHPDGKIEIFETQGFNPTAHSTLQLQAMTTELANEIGTLLPQAELYYYGAGVGSLLDVDAMNQPFRQLFSISETHYASDLLGAAHALCGDSAGIVCILGTGSNACIYDGQKISYQSPTLGYLLGDEGSGSDIGRRLIQAFFYENMPEDLSKDFARNIPRERFRFLRDLYEADRPNQRLAEVAKFAIEHKEHPFIQDLVGKSIQVFINQHLKKRANLRSVYFVGSIAHFFSEEISHLLNKEGLILAAVLRKPITQLAEYHIRKQGK